MPIFKRLWCVLNYRYSMILEYRYSLFLLLFFGSSIFRSLSASATFPLLSSLHAAAERKKKEEERRKKKEKERKKERKKEKNLNSLSLYNIYVYYMFVMAYCIYFKTLKRKCWNAFEIV